MNDWTATTFGKVARYQNGYPFKPAELNGAGLPVIRIKQLLDVAAKPDYSDIAIPNQFRISNGDLIFSWSATLAARLWDRGDALLNQHLFRVIERDGVDRRWLLYALDRSIDAMLLKTHGTTMKHITKSVLEAHEIFLPPLDEQLRIVAVLSAVDAQIEALAEEIRVMSSTLALLRNKLPVAEWVPLGDVLAGIDSGKSVQTDGEAPQLGRPRILKVSAVRAGMFRPEEAKALDATMPPVSRANEGDLLITRSNTPDRVGYCSRARMVPSDTFMPDLIWRLRINEMLVDPDYLEQILASPGMRDRITATATGTSASMRKINKRGVATVLIPLPPLPVQREFAASCRSMSLARDELAAETVRLRTVRANLLSRLLLQEITVDAAVDQFVKAD